MLYLSEVLMQEHELQSFQDVKEALKDRARKGAMLFQIDVKPPFPDTPNNWEVELENAFTSPYK
ncbi:MAG: sulfur relay protein DsrC [Gammaproteobacteria bacterium]|nr:sulfur relay protein DsrC [Gammaproteobacteria bacterium]MCW8910007.1 sulfur relay protein DsrC [Gammaproteobacteria bacterium]MCW9005544.1 sulfur relay protein DsrC [Gammaproteobacteria bacterium]MCW9056428.1 sulfur relay protein DsrC [Gammaproteobacteria bacterium]